DDPEVAHALLNLAGLLPLVGKAAEAEAAARRAIEIRRAVYGEDHPETVHAHNTLARAIQMQGRLAEAREIYYELLRRYADLYGDKDHPFLSHATNNLSATFYDAGVL